MMHLPNEPLHVLGRACVRDLHHLHHLSCHLIHINHDRRVSEPTPTEAIVSYRIVIIHPSGSGIAPSIALGILIIGNCAANPSTPWFGQIFGR